MGVKCVLFDLDGTLVSTGGAGVRALEKAFFELYGVERALGNVNPAGKTDPAIIREMCLALFDRDPGPVEMEQVQEKYLEYLPVECEAAEDYLVLHKIPELLSELQGKKVLMGLGTGNLEKGARIKLERANLNPFLPFGGFGSDAEVRSDLLKAGHRRAEERLNAKIQPEDVLVVGDTPRDISAAREANFKVIAVATGATSVADLEKHGPDFLFPDFSDVSRFMEIALSL